MIESEYRVCPKTWPCPKCGIILPVTPRQGVAHPGEIRCPEHKHSWVPWEKNRKKPKRKSVAYLAETLPYEMRFFCWMCLRSRKHLSGLTPPVFLEVHHIIPVQNGGTDDQKNLMRLCSECHSEVHMRRKSFEKYQKPTPEDTDND